jgi:quercetin dioxygenase-like cupin family protein
MSAKCTIVSNTTASTTDPSKPSSKKAANTFTGDVWMDQVHLDTEKGFNLNHVTFLPGGRTYWHTHEHGQILEVKAGSGWVCDSGEKPRRIRTGDTVICPAGTRHWHGADDGSMMMHLAISLGKTSWENEVTEDEYKAKAS